MARYDSKGKLIMYNGLPWDGKNPPYIETSSGEQCWGDDMITVFPPPPVTPEMAAKINGPMTLEKQKSLSDFEKQIGDDNNERRQQRNKSGI